MSRDISKQTRVLSAEIESGSDTTTAVYLDKLYKIIPAELTAAYLAVASFLTDANDPLANAQTLIVFAVFLTILTPFYLSRLQKVGNRVQLIVSTISFPVWAMCISTSIVTLLVPAITPQLITVVMIAWVLVTPLLVPES